MSERSYRQPRRRPSDIAKPGKKGKIVFFNTDGERMRVLKQHGRDVIIHSGQMSRVFSLELIITLLLIVAAAIFSTAIHVNNAGTQAEITRANRALLEYQRTAFAMRSQLTEQHTSYEIERLATELGMMIPDPSQIINITVSRQGIVQLNHADYFRPTENYFWQDITSFIRRTIDRIFGG